MHFIPANSGCSGRRHQRQARGHHRLDGRMPPTRSASPALETLLNCVDEKLYAAKGGGAQPGDLLSRARRGGRIGGRSRRPIRNPGGREP